MWYNLIGGGNMKTLKNVKDLTGERFGRLTVIGLHPTETRKTYWECQCDCGNKKVVRSDSLQCGAIRSCGCLKKEQDKQNLWSSEAKKKYLANGGKFSGTRLYEIWQGIKAGAITKRIPDIRDMVGAVLPCATNGEKIF